MPRRGATLRSCQRPICVNRFSVILKRPTGRSAEICLFEAIYPWPSACPFSKGRRILRDSNNPQRFHCMMHRITILHSSFSSFSSKSKNEPLRVRFLIQRLLLAFLYIGTLISSLTGKNHLSHADVFRSDFDEFIIIDPFERPFQRELAAWR